MAIRPPICESRWAVCFGTKPHGAASEPRLYCADAQIRAAVMNAMLSVDQLWRMVRREAESAVPRDPVFGAALSSAILDHPDFAHALAHQIGERLGKSPADRERFACVAGEALAAFAGPLDGAS